MRTTAAMTAVLMWIGLTMAAPSTASADEPKPRAAVAVVAPDQTDAFVLAYLFEVAATVLRADNFLVAPPNATRERVGEIGVGASECLGDETCAGRLARALGTPMILVVEVVPVTEDELSVQIVSAVFTHEGVERARPVVLNGSETEIAEAVRDAAASLTATPAPCHIDVQAPSELELTIRVGGARPTREFPIFLRAGEHRLTVAGLRRSDWLGPIRCEAGARYRVVVR